LTTLLQHIAEMSTTAINIFFISDVFRVSLRRL